MEPLKLFNNTQEIHDKINELCKNSFKDIYLGHTYLFGKNASNQYITELAKSGTINLNQIVEIAPNTYSVIASVFLGNTPTNLTTIEAVQLEADTTRNESEDGTSSEGFIEDEDGLVTKIPVTLSFETLQEFEGTQVLNIALNGNFIQKRFTFRAVVVIVDTL